jgi:hypothetical protein
MNKGPSCASTTDSGHSLAHYTIPMSKVEQLLKTGC